MDVFVVVADVMEEVTIIEYADSQQSVRCWCGWHVVSPRGPLV